MNIEHIRAFLEVTATGSFQLAADQLNVTQSTVSARIKALEDRLRQQLFLRKRNGVILTAGGHQFHGSAINVVRAWERGQQAVSLPDGQNTLLSVGIEENHWPLLVTDLLAQFGAVMPDVATSVLAEPSNLLMAKLRAGLLDVAILYDPQLCAEAEIDFLLQEDLILCSASPRDVEGGVVSGYVFVDWGDTFRAQHSAHFPGVFSHKLTLRQSAIALNHVLTHGGSGYFLKRVAAPLIASGDLFLVSEAPVLQRAVFLAARKDSTSPSLIDAAIKAVRECIA